MPTLTRYIVRQFVTNFVILLLVLMLLFILIDFVIDMDEFFEAGERIAQRRALLNDPVGQTVSITQMGDLLGRENIAERAVDKLGFKPEAAQAIEDAMQISALNRAATTIWVIIDYYFPLALLIYVFLSGLIVLGAMGFTLSALSRQRELTAMVASGISLYRVALPLVITGAVLSALALPVQELVVPQLASKLARHKAELKDIRPKAQRIDMASNGAGDLLSASDFDPTTDPPQLSGISIKVRNPQSSLQHVIIAEQGLWVEDQSAWELIGDIKIERVDDPEAMAVPPPPSASTLYPTNLTPTVLRIRQATTYAFFLPVTRLQEIAQDPAVGPVQADRLRRIVWSRFSLVTLNVVVLVMGLPFFLMRGPMNALTQSIKCAGICMTAWGSGVVALQAGGEVLNPIAAAWIPVLVLLPISAGLLASIRT